MNVDRCKIVFKLFVVELHLQWIQVESLMVSVPCNSWLIVLLGKMWDVARWEWL